MDIETRKKVISNLFKDCNDVLDSKGKSYAGTEDSLANFKRNAERLGLTKYQVWSVYFGKHIDSIFNAVKYNPELPVDNSEGMHGRILDAINYLSILYCLLYEDNNKVDKDETK